MSDENDTITQVMDQGSQFIVSAVEAKHGDIILDLCAGNGGKSLALASRLAESGGGHVHCYDVSTSRLKQLQGSLPRARVAQANSSKKCINVSIWWPKSCNSRISYFAPGTDIEQNIETLAPSILRQSCDAVLVDAPCSSSGVLRRRPGLRWAMNLEMVQSTPNQTQKPEEQLVSFPLLQQVLLARGAAAVRSGGRLIYATCSILTEENQEIARWFEGQPGYEDWEPWSFPDEPALGSHLTDEMKLHPLGDDRSIVTAAVSQNDNANAALPGHWRCLLPHVHGTDGFFVARWKKREP